MSDETIRVGDLVMADKRRKCGCLGKLGVIRIVRAIDYSGGIYQCPDCGGIWDRGISAQWFEDGTSCDLYRLKKINPPPIKESAKTKREEPVT